MFQSDLLEGKTVIITGGGTGLGKSMAMRFGKLGASLAICGRRKAVIDEAVNWKAQIVGLERGQISMALGPLLDKRMQERKAYFAKEELKTGRQDKQLRARPLQGRMQQGMVLFPQVKLTPWFEEVYNEMLRFPAGEHDDCVDALAWCFQMLQMFTVVRDPKPKTKKSWRDSLAKYTKNSSRRGYMTS